MRAKAKTKTNTADFCFALFCFAFCFAGWPDFQFGDDVGKKMHFGHFTWYCKSIVMDNQKSMHAHNVYVRRYLGGGGTKIWSPLESDDVADYKRATLSKDMFVVFVPANFKHSGTAMDITGKYPAHLRVSAETNRNTEYPSSRVYQNLWGWHNGNNGKSDSITHGSLVNRANTLVFPDHFGQFDPATKKHTAISTGKGHWVRNTQFVHTAQNRHRDYHSN